MLPPGDRTCAFSGVGWGEGKGDRVGRGSVFKWGVVGKCYYQVRSRASVFSGVEWEVLMLAGGGSVFCGFECMGT